jgi:hypothetical protein
MALKPYQIDKTTVRVNSSGRKTTDKIVREVGGKRTPKTVRSYDVNKKKSKT